jgi:shikimate dehydrogenase
MADPPGPYAEVIGDPIDHSLSPVIHCHWLRALGLPGAFRARRCTAAELPDYLRERRADPAWRGCSVTMPLKEAADRLTQLSGGDVITAVDESALATLAVNCIVRREAGLLARNTDVDGVAAALRSGGFAGGKALILGAGGAARAAVIALWDRGVVPIVAARDPGKAWTVRHLVEDLELIALDDAPAAIAGAALVINATPLGMAGAPPMPRPVLDALRAAPDALAFDMVYRPVDTPFLQVARAAGLRTIDGLAMLTAQARPAFASFFGAPAPADEAELRALLLRQLRAG